VLFRSLDRGLPATEIADVRGAIELVRDTVRAGGISAAHDVSDGGLACALAECAIAGGLGVRADLDPLVELHGGSGESALFGEGPGGFVVAGREDALRALAAEGERRGVTVLRVGQATGETVDLAAAETQVALPLGDAESAWRSLSRD